MEFTPTLYTDGTMLIDYTLQNWLPAVMPIRPEFFYYPPSVIFRKVEKKNSKIIFIFYPPSKYYCFVEKNNIFLRFCLCIFERDSVKKWLSCPDFLEIDEIFKDLLQTVGLSLLVLLYYLKKEKKRSEND